MTSCSHKDTYLGTSNEPLEALYVDLCGPFRIASLNDRRYMLTVVDQFSRKYYAEFLKIKNEASRALWNLIRRRENKLNIMYRWEVGIME